MKEMKYTQAYFFSVRVAESQNKSAAIQGESYNGLHDLQILLRWDSGILPHRFPCELAIKPSYIF